MNCPKCGRALFYGGEVVAGSASEGQPLKPERILKKFKCTYKKCSNFGKVITWDEQAEKWVH